MTIQQMKATNFETTSNQVWQQEALNMLKGKPLQSLQTKTAENITLQPLYSKEIVNEFDRRTDSWRIAQTSYASIVEQFLSETATCLANGAEVVGYEGTLCNAEWSDEQYATLKNIIIKNPIQWTVTENDSILTVFELLSEEESLLVQGSILGVQLSLPNVVTAITTIPLHNKGASAVEELAVALFKLAKADEESSPTAIRFAVDTHFFMEIAKLRAMRLLWKAFHAPFGAAPKLIIETVTSTRSFSQLDEHVNLLRAGNETFAMVLGGSDVIQTTPFNVTTETTEQSFRFARNMGLILREETNVNRYVDAAQGSFAIEALTAELVEKAWELFLEIVELPVNEGSQLLQARAAQLHAEKVQALSKRRNVLVGVNQYANPQDQVCDVEDFTRYAAAFESLRASFAKNPVDAHIIQIGVYKEIKTRTDFVVGFLQAGGVNPLVSDVFATVEEALAYVEETKPTYIVISATDDTLTTVVEPIVTAKSLTVVDIAGKHPSLEEWKSAGVNGAIYIGLSMMEKMAELQSLAKGDA